jgi:sec-independent protein translocase protein TatC
MPVMDHLRELRRRIIIMVIIVAAGAVVAWFFYDQLLDFLKKPYCAVPAKYRYSTAADPKVCQLVYPGVLDGFTSRLKIVVIAGIVGTGPLWLYQIWAFITPGLRKNERKYTVWFILSSSLLFIAGMALAFTVLYRGLKAVLELAGSGTAALLTINEYISFVTLMLIIFGCAFELPLIVIMANLAGALPSKLLRKTQRIAIFLIFVFAAVTTPSTDPFTMCAMAVPMVVLYELAVLFAVIHDKRKAKRKAAEKAAAEAAGEREKIAANDNTPSPIDPIPQRIEAPDDEWSDIT